MPIEISDELVTHVARLARLALSDEEIRGMSEHFRRIVAWVEELETLDLSQIDPSPFAPESFLDIANVGRADEIEPSLSLEEALANAPRRDGSHFSVPRIVGEAEQTP